MGAMKDFDIRIRNGGDDAIAAVSELMPCWIPVTERLPEEGERVLYYNGDCDWDYGRMVRIGVCIDDGPTGTREMRICELGRKDMEAPEHRATHWMPLPEPPERK